MPRKSLDLSHREFFTVEEVADRWGCHPDHVQHLVDTRRIAQAFLLNGPAQIFTSTGKLRAMTKEPAHARLLASSIETSSDIYFWALTDVESVFEFSGAAESLPEQVLELRDEEREAGQNRHWLNFDSDETQVIGNDEINLLSLETVVKFEKANHIGVRTADEQDQSRQIRDTASNVATLLHKSYGKRIGQRLLKTSSRTIGSFALHVRASNLPSVPFKIG